jgi:hypothetical protein
MTEYRIKQEESIFNIYQEGSGDELASFSFSGLISKSIKSSNIKLSSYPFSRKKWKIKRDKTNIAKIKFPGLFRKNLWISLENIDYEGSWFRDKKFQIKSTEDRKIICSVNKSKKSKPDHLIIEDPEHIEPELIYLLSILIYSYYDKL